MLRAFLLLSAVFYFANCADITVAQGTNQIRIFGTNDEDSAMVVTFAFDPTPQNYTPMVAFSNVSGLPAADMFHELPQSRQDLATQTIWRATLHNLTPLTRYYYKVGHPLVGWSYEYNLVAAVKPKTPSETIDIKIAAVADLDVGATFQLYMPIITSLFDNENALGLSPGNIADGFDDNKWDNWGKVVEPFSALFPFLVSPGISDFDPNGNATNYASRFTFPTPPNTKFWFSYDFSLVHIASISTYHNFTVGSEQYQWLEADLAIANTRRNIVPWVIVQGYSSMYSGQQPDYYLRQELEPLFYKYGVDLCIWNGHQFIQSKPIYDETTFFYQGNNGSIGQPYINAATVHVQVGTGGVNLITQCVPQEWTDSNLCTYGVTNITVLTNGTLFGMFRQISPEHNWQMDKQNTSCPNNCNGKGNCSQEFFKCVCQPPWSGTDCSVYQRRDYQIPSFSAWKYSGNAPGTWSDPDYNDTTWNMGATPFRPQTATFNFRQNQKAVATVLESPGVQYFRQNFHSVLPTNGSWVIKGRALFTENPTSVYINGVQIPSTLLSAEYFYSYGVFFNDSFIVSNGTNTIAFSIAISNYFDASLDIKYGCQPFWFGENCDVYNPYTGPPPQPPAVTLTAPEEYFPPSSDNGLATGLGVGLGLFFVAVAVASALIAVWWYKRTKKLRTLEEGLGGPGAGYGTIGPGELGKDWEIDYKEIQIGEELGRGAFGVVFKARWRNADCVVKQMHEEFASDKSALNNFLKEANNMKNLRPHPNVCDLLGVCTKPGSPICIVTELLSEGSLVDLFTNGKISIDAALAVSIAKDIASGMSHLHKENIVHCDLAARNLLVSLKGKDQYVIKVADFGLSHVSESDNYNLKAEAKFPIRWSAPEVMTRGQVSKMSDVWSFGVVIWEILEWKKPYHQIQLNADVMRMVCNENLRLEKPTRIEIPEELWAIMQSCWLANPNKRPDFQVLYRQLGDLEIAMGKETQSSFLSTLSPGGQQLNYLRSPPGPDTEYTKTKQDNPYEQTHAPESAYNQTPSKKPEAEYDQTPSAKTKESFIFAPRTNRPSGGVFDKVAPSAKVDYADRMGGDDHYTQTPAKQDKSDYTEGLLAQQTVQSEYFQTPSKQ